MPTDLKIDLHDVYHRGDEIRRRLEEAFREARRIKARSLEIIHGKGTGQLKGRVNRFLQREDVRAVTRKVDHDSKNWGRVFVYFRWRG